MQQRRLRLGDILDDYCPRERRITNHAVVAMIDDEIKQTRCTTCDAEHEYKQAKVPAPRRRKPEAVPGAAEPALSPPSLTPAPAPLAASPADEPQPLPLDDFQAPPSPDEPPQAEPEDREDEGPVHRRLIRATLPRPEGQLPERKAPDFTIRQSGARFDQNRGAGRPRGRHPGRQQKTAGGQPVRFGGPRPHGTGGPHGNRSGNVAGGRGGRPPGAGRGPGRKRGR